MNNHFQIKALGDKYRLSIGSFISQAFLSLITKLFPVAGTFIGRRPCIATQVLFLISSFAYSQNIDSLYSVFNTSRGSNRIVAANEIVSYSFEKNNVDSLEQAAGCYHKVLYETAEKQLEIERQQSEIERQKTRIFLFAGGLIASFMLLVMLGYIVILRTRRNRQLSETNAVKDKFFSIISHDLKNPVYAQRDSLQTLADYAHQLDAATLSEFFHKMLKSADGLADLLQNLLDWAKIQTGREMYHPVPINLTSALQTDIEVIRGMTERKQITFETLLPPAAIVIADANMLVSVVRNLLTNAVKFTSAGGTVSLHINKSNNNYAVTVSDTGFGMTPEQVKNLFRIDQRLSREGTAGEQSSGLGLIVCRDMIHKHGCELHVESEEGKGSRFWFEMQPF